AAGDLPRVAEHGASLLLSPNRTAYLDRPHGDGSVLPEQDAARSRLGLQVYPASTLAEMLDWSPFTVAPGIPAEQLAGVEAAMWCETVETMDDLELLVMPRLPGVAQAAWSPSAATTWDDHRARLAQHAAIWDRAGWNWYRADSVEWPEPD
ncbi:MAG: family 20 glycosylhydrolase, partial [Acidimicrobiia bacterium]